MLTIIPLLNSVPNIAFAFRHRLVSASVSPPVVASTDRPVGHGWPRLPRGHPFAPRRRQSGQSRFGNPWLTLVLRTRAFDRQKTHQPPANPTQPKTERPQCRAVTHEALLQALLQLDCVEGARDREAYYNTLQTMPLLPLFVVVYTAVIYGGLRLVHHIPTLQTLPCIREDAVAHRRMCLDVRMHSLRSAPRISVQLARCMPL